MKKILIIEDDRLIKQFLITLLEASEYEVIEASDGSGGYQLAMSHNPDVILLDLGLPDFDGIDWIKQYRQLIEASIIVVTAKDEHAQKVEALDLGADDYLTKPFNPAELLARIRVALRHKQDKENIVVLKEFTYKDLTINFVQSRVYLKDTEIHTTPIEYQVLTYLVKNQGRVCTSTMIIKAIWGSTINESDSQNLRVVMANLRRKLKQTPTTPTYIITHVGVGYRFNDE